MSIKKYEEEKLESTVSMVKKLIIMENMLLEKLEFNIRHSDNPIYDLYDRKLLKLKKLNNSKDNPYFSRIDFKSDDTDDTSSYYIGKTGVMYENEILVTDWRAPISSLYYDSSVGKCSYKSIDTSIYGELKLKRQFEIEKSKLIDYFDVDLVANDVLLQKYLNANNDARLKSIVSTIQKEQNLVIRKEINKNIIIQGVAGSGKTTVALHRLAYLVYNYIKNINEEDYLIIGPNPLFLKYIKNVLPELDVNVNNQFTIFEFTKKYIGKNIKLNNEEENLNFDKKQVEKFKGSIEFKNMIDIFLEDYCNTLFSNDLKIDDFILIKNDAISKMFLFTKNEFDKSLTNRINKTKEQMNIYINKNKEKILLEFNDYIINNLSKNNSEETKNKYVKLNEILLNSPKKIVNAYNLKLDVIKLYKIFINNIEKYNIFNFNKIELLKDLTLKNINKKSFDYTDLPIIMYLEYIISNNKMFTNIKHTVIDEAQDLNLFLFYSLKKILKNSTFSIFGDLAQSIYEYRSINSWNQLNEMVFEKNAEIIDFNKSYRTTREIMDVANKVSEKLGLGKSELVIRKGEKVKYTKVNSDSQNIDYIISVINQYKNKYKKIAIISKTKKMSLELNKKLNKKGIEITEIHEKDNLENLDIVTISNKIVKGLEFDAVIINDVSEKNYSSTNTLDMKLLYVALTRALHELTIIYNDDLTNVLKKN